MSERVTIELLSRDGLIQWRWGFWFYDHTLWLDYYTEAVRQNKRNRFVVTQTYKRIDKRDTTIKNAEDVVLPSSIQDEAIKKFIEGITVKRWSERG